MITASKESWRPIETAPKTERVRVRGWDFGQVGGKRHYCWAFWDGANWIEAVVDEPTTLHYLTDWQAGAT